MERKEGVGVEKRENERRISKKKVRKREKEKKVRITRQKMKEN